MKAKKTLNAVAKACLLAGIVSGAVFGSMTAAAETIAIKAARVITDPALPPRGASIILVENGRITAIGDDIAVPKDARTIDLSGYTVMPGLIDTHVHLTFDPNISWNPVTQTREYAVAITLHHAETLARAGFTTVRDLGPDQFFSQAARDAVAAGLHPGPRIIAAAKLSIIGGHGEPARMNPKVMDALDRGTSCTGAEECAAKVRLAFRNGAQAIKIMATGGSMTPGNALGQHFTDTELTSIVKTAHGLGMRVAAHSSGADGVRAAILAGVDTIEHGTFGQDAEAKLLRQRGGALSPTLSALDHVRRTVGTGVYSPLVDQKNAEVARVVGRMFQAARRAGVRIVFGTDSGVYPHGEGAHEAELMASLGGMTPTEILTSATTTAAAELDLSSETGSIATGKAADIIAVEGDPLKDVSTLKNVRFVMTRGTVIRNDRADQGPQDAAGARSGV